jgi:hypothetical protein
VTGFNNDPVNVLLVDSALVPFAITQGSSCAVTPCQVSAVFAPTSSNNPGGSTAYSTLVITDLFSGQFTLVSLSGALQPPPPPPPPTTVTIDQGSLTFDPQTVGTISPGQTLTLTNTGNQTFVITSISLIGANPGDYALSNPCTQLAAAGAGFNTCSFYVQFSPTATGTRTANVQVTGNIASPLLVSLTGTGQ